MEYFNQDGHLTKDALQELIHGEPDELHRLEIAEHLSFCDECIDHYTGMLTEPVLVSPLEAVAPGVMKKKKEKKRRELMRQYATMAVAACFTMVLWTTGMFGISANMPERDFLKEMEKRDSSRIEKMYGTLEEKFDKIVDDLYDWKGVFRNAK